MSTLTKVFIVLTTVTAIVLSCLTIAAAAQWQNTKDLVEKYQQLYETELVQRRNEAVAAAARLAMLDDALKSAQTEIDQQQGSLSELTAENTSLRNQLAQVTNDRAAAQADRKTLQEMLDVQLVEVRSLRAQQDSCVRKRTELETRLQQLSARLLEVTGDLTIANDQVRNLQEKLYASEQRIKELQQAYAAGRPARPTENVPENVKPVTPLAAGPIRGEILEVDGRYLTINVGTGAGVVEGMTFMIHRGGAYVGDLRVENVRPKEAGGRITLLKSGEAVAVGDSVEYGLDGQ